MTDVKITLHGGSLRIIRPRGNRTLDRAETEALRAFFAAEGQPRADDVPSAALEDRAQQWAERLIEALPTLTADTERSTT